MTFLTIAIAPVLLLLFQSVKLKIGDLNLEGHTNPIKAAFETLEPFASKTIEASEAPLLPKLPEFATGRTSLRSFHEPR